MIVEVVPYDKNWPKVYQDEERALQNALGSTFDTSYHIGSTSIPKLAAKPVIDILLVVPDLTQLDELASRFELLGYEVMGEYGIRGRRYYRKGGNRRTHQIHAFKTGDSNITRHIAFRDYLIAHPNVMIEYQVLKQKLALTCENDIARYCDGKDSFIKHHEAIAVNWFKAG